MNPFSRDVEELRLACAHAESEAHMVVDRKDAEDHRQAVIGSLLDAVDRIDPGLGMRFLRAMWPGVHLECDPLPPAAPQLNPPQADAPGVPA